MSSLNGAHDEILRRLNELEGLGRSHAEERTGFLHRLSTLEVRTKRQDAEEGKLFAGFQELRDIVVTHSRGTREEVVAINERLNEVHADVVRVLSLLVKPPEEEKPNGKPRSKTRRSTTRKPT